MKKIKIKNKAFTLIELLVVITIIGILSGLVIVSVQDGIGRARIAGSQRFSHSIRTRLALDMVGRWPLDNNTVDHSGWDNHGTLVTGTAPTPDPCAVRYPTGVTGQALCFDGSDDRVEVPHSATLQSPSVTVEGWFRLTNRGSRHVLITNWFGYSLEVAADGRPYFRLNGISPTDTFSTRAITWHQWYHILATFDNTSKGVNIFLNGTNVQATVVTGSIIYNIPSSPRIGWNNELTGIVDEVRIFRAAVPTSYIQKRHVQGIKDLIANGVINQEKKQQKIAELKNSSQLVIDLDAALAGPIDFSPYAHYFEALSLEVTE